MTNKWSLGLLAAIALLSSSGLAANAQSFFFNTDNGYHHFYGGDGDWRWRHRDFGWGNGFRADRLSMRQAEFDRRVAHVRRDIDFNMDRGIISGERAAMLNRHLDNIVARERSMAADGVLTGYELSNLESRLTNVEMASRGSSYY